jgi:hypothetical protein
VAMHLKLFPLLLHSEKYISPDLLRDFLDLKMLLEKGSYFLILAYFIQNEGENYSSASAPINGQFH